MDKKDDLKNTDSSNEFTEVSLSYFLDNESEPHGDIQTGIVVFTEYQQELIDKLRSALNIYAPEKLDGLETRLSDITNLAHAIAQFPSLLERSSTTFSMRTPEALVESLISYQEDGDTTLHLPAKALLGKGFLVTKMHTFAGMYRLARDNAMMDDKQSQAYHDETISMMFTFMAEDVYINLIKDKNISIALRRQLANYLIILWEHRSDQIISDIAPVLQTVWTARRTLAPAFGTMMGTSELMTVTFRMDAQWGAFLKERLSDPDVMHALEEFLFGISYEQINRLKQILGEQGVKSIGRDEVSTYLGERVKTDVNLDYRDFYLLYTVRRDNARARQRLRLDGPKYTLEDHYILFALQKQQEVQEKDTFASA